MATYEMPQVLDPDRIVGRSRGNFFASHEDRANALDAALVESCDYAQQLWQQLNTVSAYLLQAAPHGAQQDADGAARIAASPTGPDDDAGWQAWAQTLAATLQTIAGPHGDGGFGAQEADREQRTRRYAGRLDAQNVASREA